MTNKQTQEEADKLYKKNVKESWDNLLSKWDTDDVNEALYLENKFNKKVKSEIDRRNTKLGMYAFIILIVIIIISNNI